MKSNISFLLIVETRIRNCWIAVEFNSRWCEENLRRMPARKSLERPWFSLLLVAFICLGVFRVLEDPQKKQLRKSGRYYDSEITEATLSQDVFSHVTKPLNLARHGTGFSDHVLLFNRVPKSGSEMLVLLLQWLQGANGFRHVRLPGGEHRKLSILEQVTLFWPFLDLCNST